MLLIADRSEGSEHLEFAGCEAAGVLARARARASRHPAHAALAQPPRNDCRRWPRAERAQLIERRRSACSSSASASASAASYGQPSSRQRSAADRHSPPIDSR